MHRTDTKDVRLSLDFDKLILPDLTSLSALFLGCGAYSNPKKVTAIRDKIEEQRTNDKTS